MKVVDNIETNFNIEASYALKWRLNDFFYQLTCRNQTVFRTMKRAII